MPRDLVIIRCLVCKTEPVLTGDGRPAVCSLRCALKLTRFASATDAPATPSAAAAD